MEIIYLMLTLECSGHTNAECFPSIKQYETLQACEDARTIPGGRSKWTKAIIPERKDMSSVCFKSVK